MPGSHDNRNESDGPVGTLPIHCPVHFPADVTPCPAEELAPLLAHLRANRAVTEATAFPRGTLLEDGRLDLCKQSLGPGGCRDVTAALAENTVVRSLLLGTDGIGDEGVEDVATLVERRAGLEIAYLGCNGIGPAGAMLLSRSLRGDTRLTGLWLKRNPVGPEGAREIAAMLRVNQTLRVLDLVNTGLDTAALAEISDALCEDNRTLERLYVGGNAIDAEGAAHLARILRMNPTLKSLQMNVSWIGDAGATALAEALRENRTLEALGLASTGITARGAEALFAALADHPALRDLDLGRSLSATPLGAPPNAIGDVGAGFAADFLADDPPLQRLLLNGVGVRAAGRERLTAALETNHHLVMLRLEGTEEPRMAALLERNRAAAPEASLRPPSDLALIGSVYRTRRADAEEAKR